MVPVQSRPLYLLCGGYVGAGRGNLPRCVQLEQPNAMLQQLQQLHAQNNAMEVKRLCAIERSPHIWCHRERLVVIAPKGVD